jgi:hypothetical protein
MIISKKSDQNNVLIGLALMDSLGWLSIMIESEDSELVSHSLCTEIMLLKLSLFPNFSLN